MFLTGEQLEALTGLRQAAAQRRWLLRQSIPFRERADGRPSVLVADITKDPAAPGRTRPRFDAIQSSR